MPVGGRLRLIEPGHSPLAGCLFFIRTDAVFRSGQRNEEDRTEAVPAPRDSRFPGLLSEMAHFVAEISPASRAVLLLHYMQDQSLEEIAAILEINIGTVKSRLAYGLSCLRKSMERKR